MYLYKIDINKQGDTGVYLSEEVDEQLTQLTRKLDDALSVTYCAYCGAQFSVANMEEAKRLVTDHIYSCPDHPMRQTEQERNTARRCGSCKKWNITLECPAIMSKDPWPESDAIWPERDYTCDKWTALDAGKE